MGGWPPSGSFYVLYEDSWEREAFGNIETDAGYGCRRCGIDTTCSGAIGGFFLGVFDFLLLGCMNIVSRKTNDSRSTWAGGARKRPQLTLRTSTFSLLADTAGTGWSQGWL